MKGRVYVNLKEWVKIAIRYPPKTYKTFRKLSVLLAVHPSFLVEFPIGKTMKNGAIQTARNPWGIYGATGGNSEFPSRGGLLPSPANRGQKVSQCATSQKHSLSLLVSPVRTSRQRQTRRPRLLFSFSAKCSHQRQQQQQKEAAAAGKQQASRQASRQAAAAGKKQGRSSRQAATSVCPQT